MKKTFQIFSALCFLILHNPLAAQTDSTKKGADTINQRIILIGDAGQLTDGHHPVVDAVRRLIPMDKKTTVLFLGDNLYKTGLPDDQYATYNTARAVLDTQLSIADSTQARVLMIPGNHDWQNGGRSGYDYIVREQLYVDFLAVGKKNVKFYPEDGCPGPIEVPLGNDVVLILFDSQWWIHPHDKPGIESDCNCKTEDELVQQIEDIAAKNSKKLVILACHHPFKSNGPHGGFFTLKQHIFPFTDMFPKLYIPLPILGSIYPLERAVFGSPQDINHPAYQNMIREISTAIKRAAPNVLFVSGHEHNLQHIKDSSYNYIISGGGCKLNRASEGKKSKFISPSFGFGVIEVSNNKNVTLDFYTVLDSVKKAYSTTLLNFSALPESIIDSASTQKKVEDPFLKYKDTTSQAGSDRFPVVHGLKEFFMGQNYRKEWSVPVNMKVFNLNKEAGGYIIKSLGGGKQTTSLRLENKIDHKEYVLRSLNKSPTKAIPEAFRNTLAEDLVAELNSASHPYSALIVPALARPLHIPVAHPKLFFIPDDPAFGFYKDLFKNSVATLEERHATWDSSESISTGKVLNKKLDESDHLPDQQRVLTARLLDILLGDFDRHFDQWRWGVEDTGKGKIYYPIPRDRDQALFYSDGFLLRLVSGQAMPFLKGFRYNIPRVKWLGYSARDFDRLFLNDLDESDWKNSITDFQQKLADTVIFNAVKQLPPETYNISGPTIEKKLISRRDKLMSAGVQYYHYLSRRVNVMGSNQREYFKVMNHPKGLEVKVYARSKNNDTSFVMYDRVFDVRNTKEVRLYGLNDDDKFEIDESAASRIKLRLIGGKGNDTFDIRGHVENLLYDLKVEGNFIKNASRTKNRFSLDPPVNENNMLGFNYNQTKYPQFITGYNTDDRFMIGAGISHKTFGFRNLPYASLNKLNLLYATHFKAWQVQYRGEINHFTRNFDIVLNFDYKNPALRNFFGMGNGTKIDKSKPDEYYMTIYRSLEFEALFRQRFYDKLNVSFGPYYYMYDGSVGKNNKTILGHYKELGLDSSRIFGNKAYLGAKFSFVIDNRNNELYPTRGMYWTNDVAFASGMKGGAKNFTSYTTDMKIYASLQQPAKLVMVLKLGGGRIYSRNFEYFQSMNFGSNNGLYSFRKNRFSGRGSMYGALEARVKIADINSFILPGAFGFMGAYEVGRVFDKNYPGKKYHNGFGGGLYFIPFNLFMITFTGGYTEGERVFNFSLGTKVNLTF